MNLNQFNDPERKDLARALPAVLLRDRAPKTVIAYFTAYKAWKRWAITHSLCPLPADSASLALYMVSLIQVDRSVSSINSAVYGIDWVHKKNGYALPNTHPLIQQVSEAARRILAKPRSHNKPLSGEVVKSILNRLQ